MENVKGLYFNILTNNIIFTGAEGENMKKTLIVVGAASLAVAAMPIAGVFAETYGEAVVDQVRVNVNKVCNIRSGGTVDNPTYNGAQFFTTVTPGTLIGEGGQAWASGTPTTLYYSCNDAGGWKITAEGVDVNGDSSTDLVPGDSSSTPIATGTATSGDVSNWAFKVTGDGAASDYTSFTNVPASATVASSADPVASGTLTPEYRVWVSQEQEADTYTGYVKYILSSPL